MAGNISRKLEMTPERFRDIEVVARQARLQGAVRRAQALQEDTYDDELCPMQLGVSDLEFVSSLLIAGSVVGVPNLTLEEERLAGVIEYQGPGVANISYERYDPDVRQRFTIAHELGHFFLHEDQIQAQGGRHGDSRALPEAEEEDLDGNTASESATTESVRMMAAYDPVMEQEADAFAAAFLMPSVGFRKDLATFGYAAAFLSARYRVSRVAVRRRWDRLKQYENRPELGGERSVRVEGMP